MKCNRWYVGILEVIFLNLTKCYSVISISKKQTKLMKYNKWHVDIQSVPRLKIVITLLVGTMKEYLNWLIAYQTRLNLKTLIIGHCIENYSSSIIVMQDITYLRSHTEEKPLKPPLLAKKSKTV